MSKTITGGIPNIGQKDLSGEKKIDIKIRQINIYFC
jgi:hypothetical protein